MSHMKSLYPLPSGMLAETARSLQSTYALHIADYFTELTSWKHGDIIVNSVYNSPEIIEQNQFRPKPSVDCCYVVSMCHDINMVANASKHRLSISIASINSGGDLYTYSRDLSAHNTTDGEVYDQKLKIYVAYMTKLFMFTKIGSYNIQPQESR